MILPNPNFVWLRRFAPLGLATMVTVLANCTSHDSIVQSALRQPDRWQPIFRAVDLCAIRADEPRPLHVYALRVDLHDPTVAFLVTPANGPGPLETDGLKASTFLTRYRCQVAINASPYKPCCNQSEGTAKDVDGLSASRGDVYSSPVEGWGALVISETNEARVFQESIDVSEAYNGVGGFDPLLDKGENVAVEDALHPRTAVGVSKDGRYLYLVVIDGRQPGYSEGVTTAEAAQWLQRIGAHDAVNLDGGGSSTMVMADAKGRPQLINRPIHRGISGNERVNANHLGIYAKRLDSPASTRAR